MTPDEHAAFVLEVRAAVDRLAELRYPAKRLALPVAKWARARDVQLDKVQQTGTLDEARFVLRDWEDEWQQVGIEP